MAEGRVITHDSLSSQCSATSSQSDAVTPARGGEWALRATIGEDGACSSRRISGLSTSDVAALMPLMGSQSTSAKLIIFTSRRRHLAQQDNQEEATGGA